jgi:hypothetical protein
MAKKQSARESAGEALAKKVPAKKVPFAFVLDELAAVDPVTRPMFGTVAVYVGPRIVMALRDRGGDDDGVWIATTAEHHASLRKELPSLRSITVFGEGESGWQVLPAEGDGFEDEALRACELVRRGDPRVGKVPKAKKPKRARAGP